MAHLFKHAFRLFSLLLITWSSFAYAAPSSLVLSDGTEVSVRTSSGSGKILVLWFACDEGQGTREAKTAAQLSSHEIETWLPDMLGAHFLPVAPSSMESIPPQEIADVIDQAIQTRGKRVYLISSGRGSLAILRGIRAWQREKATPETLNALGGAILFYPELLAATPVPGQDADYDPVVKETRLPIVIMQGDRSPGKWWLGHLKAALEHGGSQVKTRLLPGVRGYFFAREDPTPEEVATAGQLPDLILEAIKQLTTMQGATP